MSLLDDLAEAHIEAAVRQGAFDDLPGNGRPLPPDAARHVPAELRASYRMLRNAGYVPPEIENHRALRQVEDLLAEAVPGSAESDRLGRRARWIETRLAESRRGRALLGDPRYGARLRARLLDSSPRSDNEE